METSKKKHRYTEWLSAEEMHEQSSSWMSELEFVREEQFFLNKLIKSHTIELLTPKLFDESKKLVQALSKVEKEVVRLMKKIQSHENLLEIMINDVDELKMEKAYLETHWTLSLEVKDYLINYRYLKSSLFSVITQLMKKNKQKRLLN